ncbi:MAG: hypothetical protein ACQERJ_08270 [Bacillota bacterium]
MAEDILDSKVDFVFKKLFGSEKHKVEKSSDGKIQRMFFYFSMGIKYYKDEI